MSLEDESIKELIFALRRDFKISKDIASTLSKMGPKVIPYMINAYKIDDFAFKIRIVETLGKMKELGYSGLIELLDISDFKPYLDKNPNLNFYLDVGSAKTPVNISSFRVEKYELGVLAEITPESLDVPKVTPCCVNTQF